MRRFGFCSWPSDWPSYWFPKLSVRRDSTLPTARRCFYCLGDEWLVLGFGFECLSPPAYGFVWKDRLTLLRLRVEDGSVEVAKTWPGSPLGRTVVAHVSRTPVHRAFHPPAMGRPERAAISSRLRTPRQPTADHFFLSGEWKSTGQEFGHRLFPTGCGRPHRLCRSHLFKAGLQRLRRVAISSGNPLDLQNAVRRQPPQV